MTGIVALVQARMGSIRLPGKMLVRLGDLTLLEWVLLRTSRSKLINRVVLCTTVLECDNQLVQIANRLGIDVYRGSESDVLQRFVLSAEKYKAKSIVRICADNPFIDPEEIDRLIRFFQTNQCDYACNHQERLGNRYADGFGAEIFSLELIKSIEKIAIDKKYREHVTSYIWDYMHKFNVQALLAPHGIDHPKLRFDIDTKDDYSFIKSLVNKGVTISMPAKQIIKLALANQN